MSDEIGDVVQIGEILAEVVFGLEQGLIKDLQRR